MRAIRPDRELTGGVEIRIALASHHYAHAAVQALRRLDRRFFRRHHRLAAFYARHILWGRWTWVAWVLGWCATPKEQAGHSLLETSTSRMHEREEDLQAAADKIGGHLFATQMRLLVRAPVHQKDRARDRLRSIDDETADAVWGKSAADFEPARRQGRDFGHLYPHRHGNERDEGSWLAQRAGIARRRRRGFPQSAVKGAEVFGSVEGQE